jgi:GTPase Era involved in 16S rRNA processing
MKAKTIALIGFINSGKSSFLNCLAHGLVSSVSLQRETLQPCLYQFEKNSDIANIKIVSEKLDSIHCENEKNRKYR